MREYLVDRGRNITIPCGIQKDKNIMWVRDEHEDHEIPRFTIEDDGSLMLFQVDHNDSGVYTCSPENTDNDTFKYSIKVIVRSKKLFICQKFLFINVCRLFSI